MFNKGYNSNTLNAIRSAINFFTPKDISLGDDPYVGQLFRSFYKVRPIQSRYSAFWPVEKVLSLIESWHPPSTLSLKHLTLKTLALLALSSSDRGQTLHVLNIEDTDIVENSVVFVINKKLKTTQKVLKPKLVKCIATEDPSLNVCNYIIYYLNKTFAFRAAAVAAGNPKPTQLFLSWATKKPVTKATISRWLKEVLRLAGVDSYGAHLFRGAGLSKAFSKGISITDILKAGDWTNARTFERFYNKPTTSQSVGRAILSRDKRE